MTALAVLLGLGGGVTTAGARRTAWWSTSSSTRPWFWGCSPGAGRQGRYQLRIFNGFLHIRHKMASYIKILSGQNLERTEKGLASRLLLDYTHRGVSPDDLGNNILYHTRKAGGTQDAVSENPAGDFLSRPNRFVARVEVDGGRGRLPCEKYRPLPGIAGSRCPDLLRRVQEARAQDGL